MSIVAILGLIIGVALFLYALHWIVEAVNLTERSDGE